VFQRDKSDFIFSPTISALIPKLSELGVFDSDDSLKATIHLAVSLKDLFQKVYRTYSESKKGPDAFSLLSKLTDFLTAGDLEKPDSIQGKAMSSLLKEIFALQEKPREGLKSNLEESLGRPEMAVAVKPRLNWLIDQMVLLEAFQRPFSLIKEEDLRTSLVSWIGAMIVYLNTGEGDWKILREQLDELALLVKNSPSCPSELKDLFASLLSEVEFPYGKNAFFSKNLEAQTRLRLVLKTLKEALNEPPADLGVNKKVPSEIPSSPFPSKGTEKKTEKILLPIVEGAFAFGGSSLLLGGSFLEDSSPRPALILTGGGIGGAGLAGLACHLFLKTRNHYLAEGLCAGVGALIGVGASFGVLKILERAPGSRRRSPVMGYGP
jgi:hypothetical protein